MLIISLIAIDDEQKIKDVFLILENMENKNEVITELFQLLKSIIKIIPNIRKYFTNLLNLEPSEINFIVENIDNYNEYLNIIEKNIKLLNYGVVNIFPENLCMKDFKNDRDTLFQIINILNNNNDNIILDSEQLKRSFPNYLETLNSEQKQILKNYFEKSKPNDPIIKEIDLYILKNTKDNNLIIDTLLNFKKDIWNNNKSMNFLIETLNNINLENISDEQINKIAEIVSKVKFKEKDFVDLYIMILCKIKDINDFDRIIWKIFGKFNLNGIKNENFATLNFNIFWDLYNIKKDNFNDINIFNSMFLFLKEINMDKFCLEYIMKVTEIQNKDFVTNIFNNIISKNKLKEIEIEKIFDFYISLPYDKFESSLKFLLNSPNHISSIIKDIEQNDFYNNSKEIICNFRIFNIINNSSEFKKLKEKEFYKNSVKNFDKFQKSVEDNTITFEQLTILNDFIEKDLESFKEKLMYYNEEKKNSLLQDIKSKYLFFSEKKDKLKACEEYLKEFSSTEDLKLKNMIISKIKDSEETLHKFEKNIKDNNVKQEIDKLYERVKKYNKMKNYKVTSIFINELENKLEKEEEKIKYLENKLNGVKNILSFDTIKDIPQTFLEEFLLLFPDENSLKKEIENLSSYFNLVINTSDVEKYLFFKLKKFKIQKTLNDFVEVFHLFNLIETEFSKKIIELIEEIQKLEDNEPMINFEIEKLEQDISVINQIIADFENFDQNLNLKIIPMDIISNVIIILQKNSLLKFLFGLTLDDLRDITNSIAGSSLDINDINNNKIIKVIINDLKEKCDLKEDDDYDDEDEEKNKKNSKLTDAQFLKLIPNLVKEKFNGKTEKEIISILEYSSKNQPKLAVLFDNKKGFETSKKDIKSIFEESILEIYNDKSSYETGYKVRCLFKNKTSKKTFKELLILEQLASLSQNKEKKEENLALNNFIDFIENLKYIILFINKIVSKGFPLEFKYEIYMNKGKTKCKNLNFELNDPISLSEEKIFLRKLLNEMSNYQVEAYKTSKFLKFFYGRQITMINNYLKGDTNNREEISNLIYYIIGNKNLKEISKIITKSNSKEIKEVDSKNMSSIQRIPAMKNGSSKDFELIMKEMYNNIEKYLKQIMELNNQTEESIFKN